MVHHVLFEDVVDAFESDDLRQKRRQIEVNALLNALLNTVREFCSVQTCLCESDLLCWKCLMADKLGRIDMDSVD